MMFMNYYSLVTLSKYVSGLCGFKDLIAIHDGYKILGIREVDDVMCIAREA